MKKKELYRLPTFGRADFRGGALGALALYALALVAAGWLLTQRTAEHLGFDPTLGAPWLDLPPGLALPCRAAAVVLAVAAAVCLGFRGWRWGALPLAAVALLAEALARGPLYTPFHFALWWWRCRDVAELRPLFASACRLWLLAAAAGAALLLARLLLLAARLRQRADVHGSAHWADESEVQASGLLANRGLLLGLWKHRRRLRYLRHDGPEHVLIFAPTRSGKGVGIVLPNLLSWPHSVLVHDLKSENWELTAGWRRHALGSVCLRFDPTDAAGTAARYNPLYEIRRGDNEVRDAQGVADILVDPDGSHQRNHWDRTAHALLVGLILHVLYAESDKTLRGCVQVLSDPSRPIAETLEAMITAEHDPGGRWGWRDPTTGAPTRTHPQVASIARGLLDKAENERSGVISTALAFLDLYRDPVVARNTEASDFALEDLMQEERPVSLYLTVPPSDLGRTRPLVRMLLNQALQRLTEKLSYRDGRAVPHYRHPLLLMIDEFPALGRLGFFQDSLAYLAGYGIRAMLITQDLSQLYAAYGRDESITANSHVRVAFTPNKPETAELLSRMAGEMTVHLEQRSYRGDRFELMLDHQTVSTQQTRRRLLTPDEAMRLPAEDALLFVAGQPPIRATRIRYYTDRELARRAAIPAPAVSDTLRGGGGDWKGGEG